MRAALGFIAFQTFFIVVGMAVLRLCELRMEGPKLRATALEVGPALFAGVICVVPILIVLTVLGVPLTLLTALLTGAGCIALCEAVVRRRANVQAADVCAQPLARVCVRAATATSLAFWRRRAELALIALYAGFGAVALARAPTRGDDARIWSLRGLTLFYYHGLQPEIFQNPLQAGAHPVYPLFQPAIEALVSAAMGSPQLRLHHTELWLVFAAATWSAGYLIYLKLPASRARGGPEPWLVILALVAVTGFVIRNITAGDADVTGSVILAVGALGLALWIETNHTGTLILATVAVTAAASVKNEDAIAVVILFLAAGLVLLGRRRVGDVRPSTWRLLIAAGYFLALILPWRIWLAARHLSDSVEPPLPRALSPLYVWDHNDRVRYAMSAMANQTLRQWGWVAALFLVAAVVCLATHTARAVAGFYVAACAGIFVSLVWLYTTTPLSLSFLIPTSSDRVVSLFMVLAAFATAHLVASLCAARSSPNPAGRELD
jgi:hypothetical protein